MRLPDIGVGLIWIYWWISANVMIEVTLLTMLKIIQLSIGSQPGQFHISRS